VARLPWRCSLFGRVYHVDSVLGKYCSLMRDDKRFGVAQFMRDSTLCVNKKVTLFIFVVTFPTLNQFK